MQKMDDGRDNECVVLFSAFVDGQLRLAKARDAHATWCYEAGHGSLDPLAARHNDGAVP